MAKATKRAGLYNSVVTFMQRFTKPFHLDSSFIDTEDMSKNYTDGLIPLVDLADAVTAVIGTWRGRVNRAFQMVSLVPRFENVKKNKIFSHPAFNRDTSPGHCLKLERDWLDQFATAGIGLKLPEIYGGIVLNCDSTHTGVNRIRMGMTELPFWLSDVPDQGTYADTLQYALYIAGHLFLSVNVINKRGCDIFDQHKIKVACHIYPAHVIDAKISKTTAFVKRSGTKIAGAIHNLNEVYATFDLDKNSDTPGRLLETTLNWFTRNFLHQSVDGCLCTSFAMVLKDNEDAGINWTAAEMDQVADMLRTKFTRAREAQLAIKDRCTINETAGVAVLAPNWIVSNGIRHLVANNTELAVTNDEIKSWNFV